MEQRYKLTVPDVNRLIGCYSHSIQNPEQPSDALILHRRTLVTSVMS